MEAVRGWVWIFSRIAHYREIFINTNKFLESYTEHSRPIYIPSPVTLSVIYSNFDVADVFFYKLGEVVEQIYM